MFFQFLDGLDNAGSILADVGGVAVVGGAVQVALAPATAGITGVTGLSTGAVGLGLVGFGSATQILAKFGKYITSGGNSYFGLDGATNNLNLGIGLRAKPAAAVASVIASKILPKSGDNPCG